MDHFAEILARSPLDAPFQNPVMLDALRLHPRSKQKMGAGVRAFVVRRDERRGFRYFAVLRVDGSEEDVGFRKCADALFRLDGLGHARPSHTKPPLPAAAPPRERPAGGKRSTTSRAAVVSATAGAAARLTSSIADAKTLEDLLDVLARAFAFADADGTTEATAEATPAPLDRIHVSASFVAFARLIRRSAEPRRFGRDLAAAAPFRRLCAEARSMCEDGRFDARATATVAHAIAKLARAGAWGEGEGDAEGTADVPRPADRSAERGVLAPPPRRRSSSDDSSDHAASSAGTPLPPPPRSIPPALRGVLAALETRVRRGAFAGPSAVSAVSVANFVWAFATLRWELGEKTWRAVDAAVAREGTLDAADARELSVVCWSLATAAWDPSEAAWRAIDRGVERSVASERGGRATPQAVANILWGHAALGRAPSPRAARALETRIADAWGAEGDEVLLPRDVANALWSYVALELEPGAAAREALESAARRLAPEMTPRDVANVAWALAMLEGGEGGEGGGRGGGTPARASTLDALDLAEVRLAPSMTAAEIGSAMVSRATRRRGRASASAGASAGAGAGASGGRRAANRRHGEGGNADEAWWRAVETAIARAFSDDRATAEDSGSDSVGRSARSKPVADALWAYAASGRRPGADARAALDLALVGSAPAMDPASVAGAWSAFAKLGRRPSGDALDALDRATVRAAPEMNARSVANATWAVAALSAVERSRRGGVEKESEGSVVPSCYPKLWEAARASELRAFVDANLCQMYHAKMIHEELLAGEEDQENSGSASRSYSCELLTRAREVFPAWLDDEARSEWRRSVFDEVDVSRTHARAARALDRLGIRYETEVLEPDECFSLDLYLPDHDVAVEVDGPTHYRRIRRDEERPSEREPSEREREREPSERERSLAETPESSLWEKTLATELRDLFLARRHAKLVTVPWFEMDALGASDAARAEYIREKLKRDADVDA